MDKKNSSLILRLGTSEDRDQLHQMALADHLESVFRDIPFSDEKFDLLFNKGLDNPHYCSVIVAEINSKLVGFIYCTLGEYFIGKDTTISSIQVVYVDKKLRDSFLGGKIAIRLIKAVSQWSTEKNASYLMFHVTSGTNVRGVDRLFRKLGLLTLGGNYLLKF